jgi:UDP-N-acetylglucosamine transferase subunit ALG13
VILATVGTHNQPFPRFIELLRELDDDVILQYGHNPHPEGFTRAEAFIPFEEMLQHMHDATAVVTHAGVGSILCARDGGHVPIVVPRRSDLGEHVDDHQAELARTLDSMGHVIAIWDDAGLSEAVIAARGRRNGGYRLSERPLHAAVRAALHGS